MPKPESVGGNLQSDMLLSFVPLCTGGALFRPTAKTYAGPVAQGHQKSQLVTSPVGHVVGTEIGRVRLFG